MKKTLIFFILFILLSILIYSKYFIYKWNIINNWKIIELSKNWAWVWHTDSVAIWNEWTLFFSYVDIEKKKNMISSYEPFSKKIFPIDISTEKSFVKDSHDHAAFTVLPDKKLFISYNRHWEDKWFFYRKSKINKPKTLADFSEEYFYNYETENFTCYSNTYYLKKEKTLNNFMRWLDNKPTLVSSNDLWKTWSEPKQIIKNNAIRPYVHYASNWIDKVDLIYSDWHPRLQKNSIYHIYYKNKNFYKSDWTFIKSLENLPIDNEKKSEKWTIIYNYSEKKWWENDWIDDWIPFWRAWVQDLEYWKDWLPVAVFTVSLNLEEDFEKKRIFYYYAWLTEENIWKKKMIAQAWNPLYKTETDFSWWITLDPNDPSILYYSSNAINSSTDKTLKSKIFWNNEYKLYKAKFDIETEKFSSKLFIEKKWELIIRPFIPSWKSNTDSVLWMQWKNYTDMKDYSTSINWWFSK